MAPHKIESSEGTVDTRFADPTVTNVRYTIHSLHLAQDDAEETARAEIAERYREALVGALEAAYPEATIRIDIDHRTSGCVPGPRVEFVGADRREAQEWERVEPAQNAEKERIEAIIESTWERVCAGDDVRAKNGEIVGPGETGQSSGGLDKGADRDSSEYAAGGSGWLVDADQISNIGLREEIEAARARDHEVECYRYPVDGASEWAQLVVLPITGNAGLAFGSDPDWGEWEGEARAIRLRDGRLLGLDGEIVAEARCANDAAVHAADDIAECVGDTADNAAHSAGVAKQLAEVGQVTAIAEQGEIVGPDEGDETCEAYRTTDGGEPPCGREATTTVRWVAPADRGSYAAGARGPKIERELSTCADCAKTLQGEDYAEERQNGWLKDIAPAVVKAKIKDPVAQQRVLERIEQRLGERAEQGRRLRGVMVADKNVAPRESATPDRPQVEPPDRSR